MGQITLTSSYDDHFSWNHAYKIIFDRELTCIRRDNRQNALNNDKNSASQL
jgi:hypothetical protein